ncbi:nucleolar complex protein [Reticulomyxa filosa]|uniref:Nucleolar complex protein n=1 Tax=Reticulomyxa filosa TaxID=46433 RepID=X6NWI4_RETFI|nr:nucleolar complex protein [Reticulomyxa filosa]|eukprot:ETO30336.1 nucleolar complex protein [Reticulomyxa filosa]
MLKLLFGLSKDNDIEVVQYAMLSLTRLLSDIMPQYKIGTFAEVSALKKENEQVKQFETVVLKVYRNFLFDLFKQRKKPNAKIQNDLLLADALQNVSVFFWKNVPMLHTYTYCICKIIIIIIVLFYDKQQKWVTYTDLIQHCIPLMNSADEDVRKKICDAMSHVLSQTPISNVTVECVRLITKKIEQRNFDVFPEMIGSLMGLSMKHLEPPDRKDKSEEEEKPTKVNSIAIFNKQEKKLEKLASKDLKELDGDIDKKREYERQKVIIDNLFAVYFYVLKVDVHRTLLPVALEGMSKYCHLINVELLLDLVAVVSEKLANEKDTMSLDCKLHCVITTFRCLGGRGSSVDMDIKEHYSTIYQTLLKVIYPENWTYLRLVFTCLDLMFGRSHHVPIDRTAAFVKRLTTIACHLPPQWSLPALHMARKLIRSDSRLNAMLEHGGGFDQTFDPLAQHPDHANARASCLFELTCTSQSYHPFQKLYSRDLASFKGHNRFNLHKFLLMVLPQCYHSQKKKKKKTGSEVPLGLATAKPIDLFEKYDCSGGNFTPAVKQGKINAYSTAKHPPEMWNSANKTSQIIDWFEFPAKKTKDEVEKKVLMLKGFYPQPQTKTRQLQEAELKIVKNAASHTARVARIEQMNTTLRGTKQQFRELNDFIQTF